MTASESDPEPTAAELDASEAELRQQLDDELSSHLHDLDITKGQDIDFQGVDEDLVKFQQDEFVKAALQQGVDLRHYSTQIEQDLACREQATVQDYVAQADSVAQLHQQIKQCDSILQAMQDMLSGFQSHLGSISGEIRHLQEESLSMNVRLQNRKSAESKLSDFIASIVVPPELIDTIADGPMDAAWLHQLVALNAKLMFVRESKSRATLAAADVAPTLEKLRLKAVARSRQFLLQRIHQLKKPKTNIQVKQDSLAKFKYLQEFLVEHSPETATEVRATYLDTMAKVYLSYFKQYVAALVRLKPKTQQAMDKFDVLGTDCSRTGGLFTAKRVDADLLQCFSLGNRNLVLAEDENRQPLVPHVAAQQHQTFGYEVLFRSIVLLLMETAATEFGFCLDFFGKRNLFTAIFAKTFSFFFEHLEEHLFSCHDCLEVLLLIRLVYAAQKAMTARRVPCLDAFLDRVNLLLWPKFKLLFDRHTDSVAQVKQRSLASNQHTQPHAVTQRYAFLCSGILVLNNPYNDDMLTLNLRRMRDCVDKMLDRLAASIPVPKHQIIFLINNYDHVLRALQTHSSLQQSEDSDRFSSLLATQTSLYVEEELSERFGQLVSFVKQTEFNQTQNSQHKLDLGAMESIVSAFAKSWKQGLEQINANLQRNFGPSAGGSEQEQRKISREILQLVLTQFLLYYQRFEAIVRTAKQVHGQLPFQRDLVPIQTVKFQIRNYWK